MSPSSAFIVVAVGFLIALCQEIQAEPNHIPTCPPQGTCCPPETKKTNIISELRCIKEYLESVLGEQEQCEKKQSEDECDQHSYCLRCKDCGKQSKTCDIPSSSVYGEDSGYRGQGDREEHSHYSAESSCNQKEASEPYKSSNSKEEQKPYCTDSKPVPKMKTSSESCQSHYYEIEKPSGNNPKSYGQEKESYNPCQSCTEEDGLYKPHHHKVYCKLSCHYQKPSEQINQMNSLYHKKFCGGESKHCYGDDTTAYQVHQYKQSGNVEKYQSSHQVNSYKAEPEASYTKYKPSSYKSAYYDNRYKQPPQGRRDGATSSHTGIKQSVFDDKYQSSHQVNSYKVEPEARYSKYNPSSYKSAHYDNQYKQSSHGRRDGATSSHASMTQSGKDEKYQSSHRVNSYKAEDEASYPKPYTSGSESSYKDNQYKQPPQSYQKKGQPPYQSKGLTEEYKPSYKQPNYSCYENGYQQPPRDIGYKEKQICNPTSNYEKKEYEELQNSCHYIEESKSYCEQPNSSYHKNDYSDTCKSRCDMPKAIYRDNPASYQSQICKMDLEASYKEPEPYNLGSSQPQQPYKINSYIKPYEEDENNRNQYNLGNSCQSENQGGLYKEEVKPSYSISVPYTKKQECPETYEKQSYEKKPISVVAKGCCKKIEDKQPNQAQSYKKEPEQICENLCSKLKESECPNTYKCLCEIEEKKQESTVFKSNYEKKEKSCNDKDYKEVKKEPRCYVVKANFVDQDIGKEESEEEESEKLYSFCADPSYVKRKYESNNVREFGVKKQYMGCYSDAKPCRNERLRPSRYY